MGWWNSNNGGGTHSTTINQYFLWYTVSMILPKHNSDLLFSCLESFHGSLSYEMKSELFNKASTLLQNGIQIICLPLSSTTHHHSRYN